jgi:hypothetical protein
LDNLGDATPAQLPTPHGQPDPLVRSSHVDNVFEGPARKTLISTHALSVDRSDFTVQVDGDRNAGFETFVNFPDGGGGIIGARRGETTHDLAAGKQFSVWVGLPANAAVVTYTYEGRTVWQRPLDGNAAFLHPTVMTFRDTPQGTRDLVAHPRYDPLLRAYDADGDLVTQNVIYVEGPLIGLSNVPLKYGQ